MTRPACGRWAVIRWRAGATSVLVVGLVAVLLTTVTLVLAPDARAADATTDLSRDDLGAEVVVAYGRGADAGRWTPVEVTISPKVPVAGQIAVRTDGSLGSAVRRERVEVAAGATKIVHLLLPPGEELSVGFTPRGGSTLRLTTPQPQDRDGVLVGGIGAAPALPDTLTALGSDRAIRPVAVDPALFDAGPRALEALDALVVPAADLAAFGDRERHTVGVAVAQGLDLVVPVTAGDDTSSLAWDPVVAVTADDGEVTIDPAPGAWAATGDDLGVAGGGDRTIVAASPAGDGRVVATAAAPGADGLGGDPRLWATVLQPRADAGLPFAEIEQGTFSSSLFGGRLAVPGSLGFALFVLAFLVIVGPVNVLVLRRWGRRELAWVTVPVVTVVFTLVAVGGAAARAPATSPVLRAAWWFDGVGEELTAVAVQSPSRGTATVDLPAGTDSLVAEPWSGLVGVVDRTSQTTRVGVPLQALQSATVVGWGPAGTVPIEVTATFVDEALEVELTNHAGAALTDVEVHVATHVERVDDLAADATVTVTVDELASELPRSRWADGRAAMMGMPRPRADTPGTTAAVALLRGAVLDDTPGPVWVTAALADDPSGTVPRTSGRLDDRGTLVAVGVTPTRASGGTSPYEVQRQLLRTTTGWRISPLVVEGAEEALVRFRLPPGAGAGDLVSSLETGGPFAGDPEGMWVGEDAWAGGCWEVTVTDAEGVESDPEEQCGDQVACPDGAGGGVVSCGGDDRMVEACFEDGSCQVAIRTGEAAAPRGPAPVDPAEEGDLAGIEVFDHAEGGFVPAGGAFVDGLGATDRLVSPLGEVLFRVRGGTFLDLGRRGLGVATEAGIDAGGPA